MAQTHIVIGILVLAFAPGLFWLWYFYGRDKLEPEPLHRVRNCFLLGMAACVPAAFLEALIDFSIFFTAVVSAPVIEEYFKYFVVRHTVYETTEFDEPVDGIVYAAAAALGFASLENAFYLFKEYSSTEGHLAEMTLLRAFVSVPGHALFSIMWGHALGLAKFSHEECQKGVVLMGLLLAMGMHSLFNLLAQVGFLWVVGMLVMVPAMWGAVHQRIAQALRISPYRSSAEIDGEGTVKTAGFVRAMSGHEPWYENRVLVVVLAFLFCFPIVMPVGLYGVWKNAKFSLPVKVTYSALWVFVAAFMLYQAVVTGSQ